MVRRSKLKWRGVVRGWGSVSGDGGLLATMCRIGFCEIWRFEMRLLIGSNWRLSSCGVIRYFPSFANLHVDEISVMHVVILRFCMAFFAFP